MPATDPTPTKPEPPEPVTHGLAGPTTAAPDHSSAPWRIILRVTVAVMVIVALVMAYGLYHQVDTYQQLISSIQQNDRGPVLLAFSRSLDAAVVKTSSLFVAFLLVFLGRT